MVKKKRKTSLIRVDNGLKERLDREYKQFSASLRRETGKSVSFAEFTKAIPGKPTNVAVKLRRKKRVKIINPF
tara:strand:- start:388 stop:606 length:219 start_codon:yes stop_codon:yes gene_type:complete